MATAAVPQMLDYDSTRPGGVGSFDSISRRRSSRAGSPSLPTGAASPWRPHHRTNGDVYASDSRAPIVWRLRAGSDSLERFVESPLLLNAQGLTFTARRGQKPVGLSTTRPGTLLKQHIPIRTFSDWNEDAAGFVEADLVAHCGETTAGEYLKTTEPDG